jgi:hypothetical protein
MYHLKGSPVDPNRIYASQSNGWFGQIMQRSDDGGKSWQTVGKDFVYDGVPGTHQWYDGTPHPWEFLRVWHLEPALSDPDTVYAGVEDAALFKSTDGGQTWTELSGLRQHSTGSTWAPGAGGLGLHTILLDQNDPNRIFVAISAAGAFRSDDGGETWRPINKGPFPPQRALYAKALGRAAQRRLWRPLARNQRQPAHRFRFPDRRPCPRARNSLRRPYQERFRTLPA